MSSADAPSAGARAGLDEGQVRTLRAVVDCIHPHDERGPSGTEVGVDEHILRALGGSLARFQPHYRAFLDHLDAAAQARHAAPFSDLPPGEQVTLLSAVAGPEGGVTETPAGVVDGLALVVEHTYEGLFGDPAYGGNRGGAGWRLVGYPGPRTVVEPEHQLLDVRPPSSTASIYDNPIFVLEESDA